MKDAQRTIELPQSFVAAVMEQKRVSGMPHAIYRYPARFSPEFAREAILSFTGAGDFVLDPFSGGGTAVAEAIGLGRRAAGIDISSLATFLACAKTTPLSVHDLKAIAGWAKQLRNALGSAPMSIRQSEVDTGYLRHVSDEARHFFESALYYAHRLGSARQQKFVRLVLLATGQAALDCRTDSPTVNGLLDAFHQTLHTALEEFTTYWREAARANAVPPCQLTRFRRILNRSSAGCSADKRIPRDWLPAKLVLTSPPYPGVHVLYHRWQVGGRLETPAPFWLANQRDGAGEAYYAFGPRKQLGLAKYFATLQSTFTSVRRLVNTRSLVVQLVGFSQPEWQLPLYLSKMKETGFEEMMPACDKGALYQGRVWRDVPSRRWYASVGPHATSSREVLLLHRPTN